MAWQDILAIVLVLPMYYIAWWFLYKCGKDE